MELRQLRQFLAVVEHRNLSRAAEAAGVSAPALSKGIAKLEGELGVALLTRGPRGVTPTPYGESLARHARAIAAETQHARLDIEALQGATRGRLRVGGTASAGGALLTRAVAALATARPGLAISVTGGPHEALMAALRDGALDVVVTGFGGEAPDPELDETSLREDRYVVAARRGHALARRRGVALREVAAYPWIIASNIAAVVPGWTHAFTLAGVAPPRPAVASDSYLFIAQALAAGDFLGVLPGDVIEGEAGRGGLAVIDLAGVRWPRRVRALTRRRAALPAAAGALIEALRQAGGAAA